MKEKYLVVNGGSSSLKFSLYEMPEEKELINGYAERIGRDHSTCTLKLNGEKIVVEKPLLSHADAVELMLEELIRNGVIESYEEIKGIGHRVLHGGEIYKDSVLIDDEVLQNIHTLTKLGPLHHPGEIAGIVGMKRYLPSVPQIAVFDTAFHQSIPEENFIYPVPYDWYKEYGVRKYGFHGTSHKYITGEMKKRLGKENVNLIVCHIGSGASISAIKNGACYDTTMGLTPVDGLVMGTRCGCIDPSVIEYIHHETKLSIEEINRILNNESGLIGISGVNDYRDVEAKYRNQEHEGILAFQLFRNSIVKYIAQYYVELDGNVDAIVFTAGIGENASLIRESVIEKLEPSLGLKLNKEENNRVAKFKNVPEGKITDDSSKIPVFVIPTDEEKMILSDTYNIVKGLEKQQIKVLVK